jgi:hypothetical protein
MRQRYASIKRNLIPLLLFLVNIAAVLTAAAQSFPKIETKIVVETDTTPTCVEKESHFVPLIKVGKIDAEFDDEHFLVDPVYLCTDNRGYIYVLDMKLNKIFIFNDKFKFIKTFGQTGQGPGEFAKGISVCGIRFSNDGLLYLSDRWNRKFIIFDTDGNHKKDIALPYTARIRGGFQPLIDNAGNYYLMTGPACTIDVHNIHDKGQPRRYSLLGPDDCRKSIFLKVRDEDAWCWCATSTIGTYYDILPDGRLIVYLSQTSTIKMFNGETLSETFNIWPVGALENYKKRIAEKFSKKPKKNAVLTEYLFDGFYMDKDTGAHFYLQGHGEGKRKSLLYKFDLKGNLLSIFYSPGVGMLKEKRNNRFFFKSRDTIGIYEVGK